MSTDFLTRFGRRFGKKVRKHLSAAPAGDLPLRPPLPLPAGSDEARLHAFLESVRVTDAPEAEMRNYCGQDFRRFVYTWGLASGETGTALELGANPYFTTMLLREFTPLRLTLANFFSDKAPSRGEQFVDYRAWPDGKPGQVNFPFDHFNIEGAEFPYEDGIFDVVLLCEIIEHLLMDPLRVLQEVGRVLRPGGALILTTPNVARLENVAKLISGENIYDPYSGYGPYGRHNREYNKHELHLLLTYAGFTPEAMFSADVHHNNAYAYVDRDALTGLVRFREADLGQYIFVRARKTGGARTAKPDFLYRSYPPGEIERWPLV